MCVGICNSHVFLNTQKTKYMQLETGRGDHEKHLEFIPLLCLKLHCAPLMEAHRIKTSLPLTVSY